MPVIKVSKKCEKQMRKLPAYIRNSVVVWIRTVKEQGIKMTRRTKGFHDEPLQGERWGQRSARLSKSYRLIYKELNENTLKVIIILEVNKHDY